MSFTDADARAAWGQGVGPWEEFVSSGADYYRRAVHGPALLAACGDVAGKRALDLGCGQGYFSRELAHSGASVVGVDLSEGMIALAEEYEAREPLGIDYHCASAATVGERWGSGSFDLVAACMSVQDMADIPGALRAAFALLDARGRMVFSVPHPFSDTRLREWERDAAGRKIALRIDGYFDSGPAMCDWNMPRLTGRWQTPYWRHTLAEWSGMIADAGFLIRRLHEPRPDPEQVKRKPELEDCSRLPYFLIFDLLKP